MGIQPVIITKDHPSQREGTALGGQVHVRLPETAISFARGLVIQAWVRPDVPQMAPIVWLGGEDPRIALWLLKDGSLMLEWHDAQGNHLRSSAKVAVPVGAWSRVAVALGPGGVTFVRGADTSVVPGPVALPREAARDGNAIGARPSDLTRFVGAIGEVRLWNRSSGLDVILDRGTRDLRGDEPGLVGWWTLEGAGGVADRSPFGRHGVLVGGAFKPGASSFTVAPGLDRCLDFGAGLGVVDLVLPRLRRPFTWQALVRVRDLAREATLLDAVRSDRGLRVTLQNGVLKAAVVDKTVTVQCVGAAPIAANTWASVAVRVGDDGTLTLFVDDAIVGTASAPGLGKLYCARLGPGLDGAMAEVRFWSRALSGAEIADTSRRRIHPWAPGLVGSWRMDDEVLQRQDPPVASHVIIYEHGNFAGNKALLLPGRYDVNQLGIGNDILSSLSVPVLGLQATLYKDGGFTGKSTTYTRDTALVADNDTASSIIVEARRGLVDASLAGSTVAYVSGALPAARDGLVLASAPLVIPPRVAGLGGALTLPDLPMIGAAGFTVQMWINVDAAVADQPVLTLRGAGAVTVFQHDNFGGASQTLGVGSHDVGRLTIGNDQISSLKVPRGLRAVLWEHGGFQGRSWSFSRDATSVRDANDQASSITVESLPVVAIATKRSGDGVTLTLEGLDLGVSLTPRRWTHVSLTQDADGLLCVYADGRLVRRLEGVPSPAATLTPIVGPFGGSIAEVRLWSRALSGDEVDGNWQRRVSVGAGLVGRWALAGDLSGGPSEAKGTVTWREAPGLAFKSPSTAAQATVKARAGFLADQTGGKQRPQLCVNLTALDASGRPLPLAALTVSSSTSVALYRNTVRLDNRITDPSRFVIKADARGVARLAFEPTDLSAPILKVRHDGMSEGEWALVTPDQVFHAALASLTASEVKQGRRAGATTRGGTRGLCTDGAEELVTVLRGMLGAAAAFSFEAESTAGLAFGDLGDEPAPVLLTPVGDGAQPPVVPVADDVVLVRRLGRPIAAAQPDDDDAGAVSFGLMDEVLSITTKLWEEVSDTADAVATTVIDLGLEVVESVGTRIAPIVESLTFAVSTTINGIKIAANWVVKTVEDVARAVVELFKKIGKTVGEVLDFLAELFDWSDILATARQMLADVKKSCVTAKGGLSRGFTTLRAKIRTIEAQLLGALGTASVPVGVDGARSGLVDLPSPPFPSLLDFLLSLLPDDLSQTLKDLLAVFDPIKDVMASALGRLGQFGVEVAQAWSTPELQARLKNPLAFLDSDPSDWILLAQALVKTIAAGTDRAVDFVGDLAIAFVESFERLLDLELRIPYLTDFLQRHVLDGATVTVGMLFCLVPAIPVTILYKAATGSKDGPAALLDGPVSFAAAEPEDPSWWDISTRGIDLVATSCGALLDDIAGAAGEDSLKAAKPLKWARWVGDGANTVNGLATMIVDLADDEEWDGWDWTKFGVDMSSWVLGLVGWVAAGFDLYKSNDVAGKIDAITGALSDACGLVSGIMDVSFTASDDEEGKVDVTVSSLDLSATVGSLVAGVAGAVPEESAQDPASKGIRTACIVGGNALNVGGRAVALGFVIGQKAT